MSQDTQPTLVSKGELTERTHTTKEIIKIEGSLGKIWEYRLLPYDIFFNDDLVSSITNQTSTPDIARVSEELYSIATSNQNMGEPKGVEMSRLITKDPENNLYLLTASPPGESTHTFNTQSFSPIIPPDHKIFIETHNHPNKAAGLPSGEGFSLGDLNHSDPLKSQINYKKSPTLSIVTTEGGVYFAMYPVQLQKLFKFGEKLISKLSESSLGKKISENVLHKLNDWQTNREEKKIRQEVPLYINGSNDNPPKTKDRLKLQDIVAKNRGVRVYFMNYNDRLAFRIV